MKIDKIISRMEGGIPYWMQIQQIYEWRNNHPQVFKKIQMVQNHTSQKFQQPEKHSCKYGTNK